MITFPEEVKVKLENILSKIADVFTEYSEGLRSTVFPAATAPINGAIDNWNG